MSNMVSDVDQMATKLLDLGLAAHDMAPAWERYGIRQPAMGEDGQFVGWMLPGRGLLLDGLDKKRIGITRDMPFVYDYTPFARKRDYFMRRFRDLHRSEVGAITGYDGVINARANGKARDLVFAKSSITTVAGFWFDTWTAGGTPGAGSFLATTPPTDVLMDSATTGSLSDNWLDPTGSDKAYLLTLGMSCTSAHNFALLIDRHVAAGNFTLVAGTSTITTPKTIVRNYGGLLGAGAQMVATITTIRGTPAAGTLAATYLDENAASSTSPATALATTPTAVAGILAPMGTNIPFMPLAAGDVGVRQVSSTTRAATGDASGAIAISVVQPLVWMPALGVANLYVERDLPSDLTGLLELANVSLVTGNLSLLVFCNTTTLGSIIGFLRTCQG